MTAVAQARDLLRWRSPLRTELWASRIAASWSPDGGDEADALLERAAKDGTQESLLLLAALAALGVPEEAADRAGDLPEWAGRMGRVRREGAWYGKADPYGEQVLAVLAFRYENGKEPHLVVVAIDQVSGGLAVDALVEEPNFLDDLDLREVAPDVVAGRVLDAFTLTDSVLGAATAETLAPVRSLVLARARSIPGPVQHDDAMPGLPDLPDLPGAKEAFGKLAEFVGDRPLWWSPARVSQFLTSWLPREAVLSDDAIAAMPEVVRAWTRFSGGAQEVLARIDADAPKLPALMADESLAGPAKRLGLLASRGDAPGT